MPDFRRFRIDPARADRRRPPCPACSCRGCGTDEVQLHKFEPCSGLWCWACIEVVQNAVAAEVAA